METEIIKADKRYRNRLFTGYILLTIFGTLVIKYGIPLFRQFLITRPIPVAMNIAEFTAILFLLSFIGPAYYLISIGRKVLKFKCAPYPGMKVIRDTKVNRGKWALLQGKLLIAIGIFSIVMAITGSILTHHYFVKFRSDPIFKMIFKKPSNIDM